MKEGMLGLIVLYSMVIMLLLGFLQLKEKYPSVARTPRARRRTFLQALILLALPFFIWAIVNTSKESSLDLGIFSMGFVCVSAGVALLLSRTPSEMRCSGYACFTACLLTAANVSDCLRRSVLVPLTVVSHNSRWMHALFLSLSQYGYVLFLVKRQKAFDFYASSGLAIWLCCGIALLKLQADVATDPSDDDEAGEYKPLRTAAEEAPVI